MMVFIDLVDGGTVLAGLVTGFDRFGGVLFRGPDGDHCLDEFYSWLHVVCPD